MDIIDFKRYFFVIDSKSFSNVTDSFLGFTINNEGLWDYTNCTDSVIEQLDGCGIYIIIKRSAKGIKIFQYANAGFGLYLYQSKEYFALSNSIYMLIDYLKDKQEMTLNVDVCNHYLSTWMTNLSFPDSIINEIKLLPANCIVNINNNGTLEFEYSNYDFNSIELDSQEGMDLLDKWYEKWIRFVRSLWEKNEIVMADLSGGFDSRLTLMFLINSGANINDFYIHSLNDEKHTHKEDYIIATKIAEKYHFELNRKENANFNSINLSLDDIYNIQKYVKKFAEKEESFPTQISDKRVFYFGGFGGELVRPYWYMDKNEFILKEKASANKYSALLKNSVSKSIEKVLERTYNEVFFMNSDIKDYKMIPFNIYREVRNRNHFGKICLEAYILNRYKYSPCMDPVIQKLKLSDSACDDKNLLYALCFVRFGEKLLNFEFEGNRCFSESALKEARRINTTYPYKNDNVSVIKKIALPEERIILGKNNTLIERKEVEKDYIKQLMNVDVINCFEKYFSSEFIEAAISFAINNNFFPYRHINAILSIEDVLKVIESYKSKKEFKRIKLKKKVFNIERKL